MALDKQKILNELGNVVNQLQNADCGCMGKLFSNCPNGGHKETPEMYSLPTCGGCRRGCCHGHGYASYGAGTPCAGEPYTMAQACGGQCANAPKLYADTYNYLSHNLMQPAVKEVYDDLKFISPANTIMNNPIASQQMAAVNNSYGQHTQGVMKFNEMFPGVMGSDLGFDPMAIAIQMNPANQQKAAMDTMQKLMTGQAVIRVPDTNVSGQMQSAVTGANAAVAALNPPPTNQQPVSNQEPMAAQQMPPQTIESPEGNLIRTEFEEEQEYVPPRPTRHPLPDTGYPATRPNPEADQYVRDPIYPVDVSKRSPSPVRLAKHMKSYEYNTLGQPIEMLPARLFHTPYANVPQTLSPQPVTRLRNDIDRHNVKPTISKTALMGNKPVGSTPSRSQLQHIYNQYKGSQSYTQQNIRPSVQGASYSERRLNVQGNAQNVRQVPVERVGGDTIANNQIPNQIAVKNMPQQEIGDVPAAVNKPHGDVIPTKEPSPLKHTKLRNGLQDIVYTSYPTAAAWSFHGHGRPSAADRYRARGF